MRDPARGVQRFFRQTVSDDDMTTIAGLPAHPLFVHLAVVLVPLAAILVLGYAMLSVVRSRLGIGLPVIAAFSLLSAKLAESAGEGLEKVAKSKPDTDVQALHEHAQLGEAAVLWAAGIFLVAAVLYLLHGTPLERLRHRLGIHRAPWMTVAGSVLAIVVLVGGGYAILTAGHSGAQLAWGDYLP